MVLSSFIFPRLSDTLGRKKITLFGVLTHLVAGFLIILSGGFTFSLAMSFMMGFAVGARVFVGYVWLVEHMRTSDAGRATCALFFFDSSCIFWASLYFKYISKDWRFMFGLPCIALCVSACTFIFMSETAKFYYGIGQYDKAREVLTEIGRTNGILGPDQAYKKTFLKELESFNTENLNRSESAESTPGIRTFLKDDTNRMNTLIFASMAVSCSFVYYLINFYVKYLPGDIYTNQMVNSVAESCANGGAVLVLVFVSQRYGFAICYVFTAVACIVVMLAEMSEAAWLVPIGVLVGKSSITCAFAFLYFTTVDYFES